MWLKVFPNFNLSILPVWPALCPTCVRSDLTSTRSDLLLSAVRIQRGFLRTDSQLFCSPCSVEIQNQAALKAGYCIFWENVGSTVERTSLVRDSIANPWMDFQQSTDINMDSHDFWISASNYPYKRGYPHWYPSTDIHGRTFRNGFP